MRPPRPFSLLARAARLAALPVALLITACYGALPSAQTPTLGTPVPASLRSSDGAPVAIPVAGARSVLLDFWSPSCEPCRRTLPAVLARSEDLRESGAAHVLVAVLRKGESENDARAALAAWGVKEPFVIDEGGAYFDAIGARDVPAFAIVDAAGVLRWVAPDGVTITNVLDALP